MDDIQAEVDSNDDLDPRIQEELNLLNTSSNDINRLENEIDEARAKYRLTFSDASHKIGVQGKELKKEIQRARQYYHVKEAAVQAQSEALRAARQFQTANGIYKAAKETIALAEQRLMDDQSAAMLSSAWQEMLNHATIRVMDAERDKTRSEEEHLKRSSIFANLESKLQFLEKKFKKSIIKARPYFEMKAELELRLQQQKQNIDDLQNAIKSSKVQYSESLRRLEDISEEIHESRRQKILLMFPREPGVGADNESLGSSISDVNLERGIFSASSRTEDHLDSDVEDSDDVFDSHATSDASSLSLSELSKDLPTCSGDTSVTSQTTPSSQKGGNSLPVSTLHSVNGSNSELDMCAVVNKEHKSTEVNKELNPLTKNNSISSRESADREPDVTEGRECGSGAEQSPVCSEHGSTCREEVTGCDVTLPERDENQTEGSSDPEDIVKDLKTAGTSVNENNVIESTAL